jgi:hypothetical protein
MTMKLCPEFSSEVIGSGVSASLLKMVIVNTISNSVHFPTGRKQVSVEGSSLDVFEGPDEGNTSEDHEISGFFIGSLVTVSSLHVRDEVGDIISQLGSGSGGTIFVFEHTIIKLSGHTNDHMIIVRVEVFTLGDIDTIRRLVVVTGQDVEDIVDTTRSESNLGQIDGPDTVVGVFTLILREIGRIDSVVNVSISFIPFLIVVLLVMVMGRVDGEVGNKGSQFQLFVGLIQQGIVLLVDHTVTIGTVSSKDQETSSDTGTIVSTEESELRPVEMTVMGTDFSNHFFVTLNTPMGTDIISVHPAFSFIFVLLGEVVAKIGTNTSNCYKTSHCPFK